MSPERHEKSERRPPVSWRPCATAAIERTTCDLSCLSVIRDNLLLCLWPSKRKPRQCGESTGKSDQESVTKSPSVPVRCNGCGWFESCCCWFLESASEVKQRERVWWEAEVTSALHCVLWETKHPSARSPQWKSQPSNSFSPQQCKWWSWNCAVWQGSTISREFHCFAFKFQAQADDADLYWGIFIAILIREENKSSIFHPRSRMSWLTAEEKP